MVYVGIDPGITGAVAVYDAARLRAVVYDMPVKILRTRSGRTKRGNARKPSLEVDHVGLFQLCRIIALQEPAAVVLEDVWGMPGQGASQFSLGDSVGTIRACLHAAGLEYVRVAPARWTSALGIRGVKSQRADKSPSLALAAQLFPSQADRYRRKIDNGRADASLIAYWASTNLYNPT